MGGGRRLWALGGLSICGPWSSLVGVGRCSWVLCHCCEAGLLFVRTGLLIVGVGLVPVGGLFVCAGLSFLGAVVTCRLLCGRC